MNTYYLIYELKIMSEAYRLVKNSSREYTIVNASTIHFVTLSLAQKNDNMISSWKCLAGGE
jgi:hypothetical protein